MHPASISNVVGTIDTIDTGILYVNTVYSCILIQYVNTVYYYCYTAVMLAYELLKNTAIQKLQLISNTIRYRESKPQRLNCNCGKKRKYRKQEKNRRLDEVWNNCKSSLKYNLKF